MHLLSSHRNVLLLLGLKDGRSGAEQVLTGFQDCLLFFGFYWGGLICSGFRLGIFVYSGRTKAGIERGGGNKNPAVLANTILKWFGLFSLLVLALLMFLSGHSRPNTVFHRFPVSTFQGLFSPGKLED